MLMLKNKLPLLLMALVASLSGCGSTPALTEPGVVVEAPKLKAPKVPAMVQETQAKPTGYFLTGMRKALSD